MEFYNICSLRVAITKVLYTPGQNRFRLHSAFYDTSVQNCKYLFLIYCRRQRFVEIGFNDPGVYKFLRFIFREKEINKLLIKLTEIINGLRSK